MTNEDSSANRLRKLPGEALSNLPPPFRVHPYQSHGQCDSITDMHETFEHTADLGLRARAANVDTLFVEAATALFATIVDDLSTIRDEQPLEVMLAGGDREYLLFDWLRTLLYHFDAEHLVFSRFEVKVSDAGLVGRAWGEPLDRARHELTHEVKAITYHGLKVEQTEDGWLAEVIVDI